jgi:hypothetical protein
MTAIRLSSRAARHANHRFMTTPASPPVPPSPATLHYGDGEFAVLRPGAYVSCAVSGVSIPLAALRYWSVERQEAYASPLEFMAAARDA